MFSQMQGPLVVAIVLAVVVMVAAAFAEGRAPHLIRLALGLRPRRTVDDVMAPVPRGADDWELVDQVNSRPDRPAPGTRAAHWTRENAARASHVVAERAKALAQPADSATEPGRDHPHSGELALGRQ